MSESILSWFSWWGSSDWIVRGVFIVLIIASLLSWSVMLYKMWQLSTLHRREKQLNRSLASKKQEITSQSLQNRNFQPSLQLLNIADDWLKTAQQPDRKAIEANMAQALMEQRIKLENGLTFLATVGSSAPFIGLLGTVWGIMHALQGLGGEAALSMDMIAGPVSEALVATAVGLFAAIPAVMSYNMLVRKLRRLTSIMEGNALLTVNQTLEKLTTTTAKQTVLEIK
ncbi:MAG: MotA/TolQ/ExbB proton channel family protein [Magnetococcales bacterium]|nr:MotA/TolQ/ExbB proton channel family protein [Magnetococcales bacterium]